MTPRYRIKRKEEDRERGFNLMLGESSGGYNIKTIESIIPQRPVPLRDWEFKLATGEFFKRKESSEGGGFFETVFPPEGAEELSANVYAGLRTAAEVLPYTRYLFPSGRDEWARKTTSGQTIELGLEALSLLPIGIIGKGFKILSKGIGKVGAFPFRVAKKFPLKQKVGHVLEENPFLDIVSSRVKKFERLSPEERLIKKYGVSVEEASAVREGRNWVWVEGGRSGAMIPSGGSAQFKKLFTRGGVVLKKVQNQLESWSKPFAEQELRHYQAEWRKLVRNIFGVKYKPENVFKMQAVKIFGEEGTNLSFGDVNAKTVGWMIRDLLEENPAKLFKRMDIGYEHIMPYHFLPVRKVFGGGDRVWGTYSGIYEPVKEMFSRANRYATLMTSRFHSLLASRGLGKLVSEGDIGVVKLKRAFSKREWEQAGELATMLDDAIGKGFTQEQMQNLFESAPTTVQKIVKSWYDFTDSLYSDYAKKKISSVFQEVGLTEKGKDGLYTLLRSPNGIEKYIDVAFSQSANLAHADKAKVMEAMLNKARQALVKNPDWFLSKPVALMTTKEKDAFRAKLLRAVKELFPMKKGGKTGFVNYLDNYTTRLYEKQFANSIERVGKLARSRKAGAFKSRTRPFGEEGRITDLTRIAEARINMQAKELYVYRPLEDVVKFAERLPDKFRNYSEHYISRQLGEPSYPDIALAQWLTGTLGRFTKKVYDERSVMNLAHTVNDLVYMGGLGFKPFSAMRNYFQPLLMVPADMGGVKDLYWLGKGYSAAFRKPTRDYIKSIGAIQEFAPDLYLRPRVVGFGGSFTVGGKKFNLPSTQTMRDLALWMFKNSDRHNRYVTGGAAIEKWDYFTKKFLSKDLSKDSIKQFKKKLNLGSRDEEIRIRINEFLRKGTLEGLEEAKKLWVYDVIADTQYLYGTLDAPIYGQAAGSLGKMAGVFQSWWMNYGTALEKWALRTPGTIPIVNKRTMTWILAGAIVEECASGIWPQETAKRMVHLGPFPTRVSEFMIPPTFAPVYYTAKTLADSIDMIKYQEPEKFRASVKALGRSSLMFVPGGLQAAQFYRGAKKEGWEGFRKAFIRYDPEKEEY